MKKWSYYNENNPEAAQWIRSLIKNGEIPDGEVDERSIEDVRPIDVRDFVQAHWFSGICGWPLALRIAGWPEDKPVWTGSCPCQPFSSAGKGAGFDDERHLWPAWMHLIRQCRPGAIFGEQVAAAVRHGWLDTVLDDLENTGYACWAADLPAAGIGAPHLRERVWFVGRLADDTAVRHARGNGIASAQGGRTRPRAETVRRGNAGKLADSDSQQRNGRGLGQSTGCAELADGGELGDVCSTRLAQRERDGRIQRGTMGAQPRQTAECAGDACELARTDSDGCEPGSVAAEAARYGQAANSGGWDDCFWLPCTDGEWRPTQPGLFPLAHGIPKSLGPLAAELERLGVSPKDARSLRRDGARLLRSARAHSNSQIKGYGNAIVPQVAAEFIRAVM